MGFKDKLRALRKARHYTQDDLSKLTGLSVSAISMYENGRREPSFEILEMFADYFNVDMNTLLDKQEIVLPQQKKAPLSAKEFLQILCKNDTEALAVIDRLELTQNGELKITGADLASQAVLDHQIRGLIAALKNAKLTDEGMLQFNYSPDKQERR